MGRIWRALKLGMRSLLLHKLRSGLTVLGIVFGVAAVISMLAVGEGSSRDAQERIQALGATNIMVRSVKPEAEALGTGGRMTFILEYGLTYDDYDRILATVPSIKVALPIREFRRQIRRLNNAIEGRVVGTTHDYASFNLLKLAKGRFLSDTDNEKCENYAVLAANTADALFPYEDPLGQRVKLGSDYYTVIGVTEQRATSAGIGGSLSPQDFNKDIYIPLNTCRLRFGELIMSSRAGSFEFEKTQLSQITIQVGDIDEVRPSVPVISAAVLPYHEKKDVKLAVPYDLLMEAQRTARNWKIVLGSIAAISLVVGGIGIMNIMLATVTERTREIGIRRSLGAKRRDITQQFLIETIVLSGVGGMLGVLVGMAIPQVIVYFMPDQKPVVTLKSIAMAFSISVAVGIVFGLYPARRAAMMDPIEALRHE